MALGMPANGSMKTSFLCKGLVKECSSMENKPNWTERKKASSVKSSHTHLVE